MSNTLPNIMVIDDDVEIINNYKVILSPGNKAYNRLMEMAEQPERMEEQEFVVEYYRQGEDGYNALLAAQAEGRVFSVIFLDMRMPPGWDGLRTAEAIRGVDRDVYIVIVTAHTDRSWDFIEKELGDKVLIIRKPFTRQEIIQAARVLSKAYSIEIQCRVLGG